MRPAIPIKRVLVIKTSSLGDVIHNLPVISDIAAHLPAVEIDWVVEEAFATIPAMHPGVRAVIPVALRRWRRSLADWRTWQEMRAFKARVSMQTYDVVLDTQGLLKSALIALVARGSRSGHAWPGAREPLAACFYRHRYAIDKRLHAVERNRLLAACALRYELNAPPDYGIARAAGRPPWLPASYSVLLHATSRSDKAWPEPRWIALGRWLGEIGITSLLPWGTADEKARSQRLAAAIPQALVAPQLALPEAAEALANAVVTIGVDTGLTHLAAALGAKVVAIYVATSPGLTGVYAGPQAINLGGADASPDVAEVQRVVGELLGGQRFEM